MNLHDAITLAACAAYLALAAITATRLRRTPLALPLMLLCADLFTWNAAALAFDATGRAPWHWIDRATSPLTSAFALHLIVAFVGRRRRLRGLLASAYLALGALGATTALALFVPSAREFADSRTWAVLHLGAVFPAVGAAVALLIVHHRHTSGPEELVRTRLMLAALAVGTLLGTTDLLFGMGWPVPRLGSAATLASTLLLATAAMRFKLLEDGGARREHVQHLATLGRFAAQMAHDLKNPLAALKGATQFLREERAQGRSLADQPQLLDLIHDQVERLSTVVDQYQRLGRVEPVRAPVHVNNVVEGVLALQGFAAGDAVQVRRELAPGLPDCRLDRDLLAGALENLVRNALEALPAAGPEANPGSKDDAPTRRAGVVTVRTERAEAAGEPGLAVSVEDTGQGMDARTLERAFDDFFTTKPGGTGHGLAFVRRVALAHGGEVAVTSRQGRGTVVKILLPLS